MNPIKSELVARLKKLLVFTIAACGSLFCLNVQAVNCSNLPEWNSATAYGGGSQVKQSGKAYKANWWSQGHSPASYSGQWQEWSLLGNCDGATTSSRSSSSRSSSSSHVSSSIASNDCGSAWYRANLTHYESYPAPGSDECIIYNGCLWSGYFYGISGKQPESWVMANNIAAVHLKDWSWLGLKTLNLRQGSKRITVKVYDGCSDSDCNGCCSANLAGDGYLIDLEKYTMQRFGSGSGIVEFQVCN